MKCWQVAGSFGLENLALVERPDPTPGPGQVRVRVKAAALNYRDLLMVRGHYDPRQPLPLVPLSDGVGEVDAVGDGVDDVKVGQRVAGLFSQRWQAGQPGATDLRSTLGGPIDGMLTEQIVLPASGVIGAPAHLSDAEASTLPCAALTAWSAVVTEGRVQAGSTVLVQGTGGVSSFALDFARIHGARVIATTSSAEKAAWLKERGAWETINYKDNPKWGRAARQLTGGVGVDLVVEVGGAGTIGQSLRAVRPSGTVCVIGVLAGAAAEISLLPVLMNQVRVQGIFVGSAQGFAAMNRALTQHELRPVVDRVFPFEDAVAAFEHLAGAGHRGKVVIKVA